MKTKKERVELLITSLFLLTVSCIMIVLSYEEVVSTSFGLIYIPLAYVGFYMLAEAFKID